MSLRPFDLDEAKAGKPIVQRGGARVVFLAHLPDQFSHSIVIALPDISGRPFIFPAIGRQFAGTDRSDDLFMAPDIKTVRLDFIKSLKTGEIRAMKVDFCLSEEWVVAAKNVEVTFTEGEGLS